MNIKEFVERFPDGTQIGMYPTDSEVKYFHDNGTDVGMWIYNRGDTTGRGEILSPSDAEQARHFYGKPKTWAERVKREGQGHER